MSTCIINVLKAYRAVKYYAVSIPWKLIYMCAQWAQFSAGLLLPYSRWESSRFPQVPAIGWQGALG